MILQLLLPALALGCPPASDYGAKGVHVTNTWTEGIVPWVIESNPQHGRAVALAAMQQWEALCDVRFAEWTDEPNYVAFKDSHRNASRLGERGGRQTVELLNWSLGTVTHEIGHTLGLHHEHQRPDRDQYIHVNEENIEEGAEPQFWVQFALPTVGPYDFGSIMHYRQYAFSVNGQPTIEVLPPNEHLQDVIGWTGGEPSAGDGRTVRVLYGPWASGDLDHDGDIDADDFGEFQACMAGAGVIVPGGNCDDADLDADGDVDQSDFGVFQRCLSGRGVEASDECM